MFFVQISTLPPRMHHKFTKHGRFCKQNNQLPTKTHVELKDNSIDWSKLIATGFATVEILKKTGRSCERADFSWLSSKVSPTLMHALQKDKVDITQKKPTEHY
jgi:hypothetical protein